MKIRQIRDDHADPGSDSHAVLHGLLRPVFQVRAHILRHKRRHGLHDGRGDQHDKRHDLLRHPVAGGSVQPQPVDKRAQGQEGQVRQKFLQGQRRAQAHEFMYLTVRPHVGPFQCKRQFLPADDRQGQYHAHRLGRDGGDGRPCHVHMEHRHQQKVSHDIYHTGDGNEDQREAGIAHPPENTADHIIGHHKDDAASADADILYGQVQRLRRGLHQHGQRPGEDQQRRRQDHCQGQEKTDYAPDDLPYPFRAVFAQVTADQHRDAHGQPCDGKSHQVDHIAPRGNA